MPELDWSDMPIHLAIKADRKTPERLIEGSLGSAKTTIGLDCELDAVLRHPGIPILMFRWTEDAVATKLRPALEELMSIRGMTATWDAKQKRYDFENGSMIYMFGLKAVSSVEMFNKIRGLGVCRIMGDQVEEMQPEVAGELRGRLRPDLTATMSGRKFPFQLTFIANPSDTDFWLSREFPEDDHIKGRKLYSLSVFDNKWLPKETVESLLRTYSEDHPKNRTLVLGKRGPRVYGVPVYEGLYRKDLHWRPIEFRRDLPILESFEFGKHNPVWCCAQAMFAGGLAIHGGVLGLGLTLEDFVPIVQHYRSAWYPAGVPVQSCLSPQGEKTQSTSARFTGIDILRQKAGITPRWADNGNAADVRLAMIENISAYLRKRNVTGQEQLAVNNDPARFLIIGKGEEPRDSPFVHHSFEGGYTWSEHFVSVSSKELRQPREDDKFANIMHCIENIELNFCAGRSTGDEKAAKLLRQKLATRSGSPNVSGNSWMM